jgi:hypothetical protein
MTGNRAHCITDMNNTREVYEIMKLLVKSLIIFCLIIIIIQFVPVNRTNPPVDSEVPATDAVRSILRRACYDCHSNETVWPWYSRVAPVSWLVASDVLEGREKLNFSTWNRYNGKKQTELLKEIRNEVEEGEMPPITYRMIHKDARITAEEIAILKAWAVGSTPGYEIPGRQ